MSYRKTVEDALVCFAEPSRRDAYFDLYSEDVVLHGYEGVEPGLDSVKRYYAGIWAAFPDARVNAEEMIEINDRIILCFIMTGTHHAPFLGLNATGRSVRLPGMTILRFMNQKCVERWSVTDSLSSGATWRIPSEPVGWYHSIPPFEVPNIECAEQISAISLD